MITRRSLILTTFILSLLCVAFFLFSLQQGVVAQADAEENFRSYLPVTFNQYTPPTWIPLAFNDQQVAVLLPDPEDATHLVASVYLSGLFETRDNGRSWQKLASLPHVKDLARHPLTSTTMYAASLSYNLHWTTDDGQNWDPIPGWSSIPPFAYSVAVHPLSTTVMFVGTGNWEPHGGEIYKSVNSGKSWYPVSPAFTSALSFAFHPVSPTIVYAGTKFAGVKKSVDMGETWVSANSGLPDSADYIYSVQVHPETPSHLYVATEAGVFSSEDGATTWEPSLENVAAGGLLMDPRDSSTLYVGTTSGIYTSQNAGQDWQRLGACGGEVFIRHLVLIPAEESNVLWAATDDGLWQCVFQ